MAKNLFDLPTHTFLGIFRSKPGLMSDEGGELIAVFTTSSPTDNRYAVQTVREQSDRTSQDYMLDIRGEDVDLLREYGWYYAERRKALNAYQEAVKNRDAVPHFKDVFKSDGKYINGDYDIVRVIVTPIPDAFDFSPALYRAAEWHALMMHKLIEDAGAMKYNCGKGRPEKAIDLNPSRNAL
jgi:hypothetical protein